MLIESNLPERKKKKTDTNLIFLSDASLSHAHAVKQPA